MIKLYIRVSKENLNMKWNFKGAIPNKSVTQNKILLVSLWIKIEVTDYKIKFIKPQNMKSILNL